MILEPIDRSAFRGLMRNMPGAVSIVATGAPGRRKGLTASAVCSLTDLPPTVLVCVNQAAGAHDVIVAHGYFSVNLLGEDQEEIARVFAGHGGLGGEERFAVGDWTLGATGVPVLASAVCRLECRLTEQRAVSSHSVFFGEVVGGTASPDARPLVYHRGAYVGLAPLVEEGGRLALEADRPL